MVETGRPHVHLRVGFLVHRGSHPVCSPAKPDLRPVREGEGKLLVDLTDEQVLKQTRHWLEKAVIGLNLCPFAKAVYVKNQIRLVVSHARHADDLLEELDSELALLVASPAEEIDTTLLIHPTLFEDFLDFNDFMEIAEGVVGEHELEGIIQLASFHPKFQFDGTELDDIGNFTNRAPFAMLHLLREESIERAVQAFPQAEVIFEENIKTLEKLGHSGWVSLGLLH